MKVGKSESRKDRKIVETKKSERPVVGKVRKKELSIKKKPKANFCIAFGLPDFSDLRTNILLSVFRTYPTFGLTLKLIMLPQMPQVFYMRCNGITHPWVFNIGYTVFLACLFYYLADGRIMYM
jgi:hypothetical protein